MKNSLLIALLVIISASFASAQMKVNTDGKIKFTGNAGFGKDPSTYKIDLSGQMRVYTTATSIIIGGPAYYGTSIHPSSNHYCNIGLSDKAFDEIWGYDIIPLAGDIKQKENIRDIDNPLDKILAIKGIKYDLKKEFAYDENYGYTTDEISKLEKDRKDKYGLIAQDLQKVLPEVVKYVDSTDVYGIRYISMIPILIEAIKEQNKMILDLQKKIQDKNEKSASVPTENSTITANLSKNRPNPFSENTTIEYYLPHTVRSASLFIYDFQGKQLKNIHISERDHGAVTINGYELQPGMYYYTLIADGNIVGTENMILTDKYF